MEKNQEKYIIWHVQGGLGKNVAATALCKDIREQHKDRKFILVCSWPEVFLNNPYIDKVYNLGNLSHFYEKYIENKDVVIFKHEPYNQTGHITKQKHLIENWCDLLGIKYTSQTPKLYINYAQKNVIHKWARQKSLLLLQTTGGPLMSPPNPDGTPNNSPYHWTRDLPIEIAQEIVNMYSSKYHIIHLTRQGGYPLQGVERVDYPLTNTELFALVGASQKLFLIDSVMQHAASALKKPAVVFWVGTSPKVFGYQIHKNIQAKLPKKANQLINSYTFDYQFDNNAHECPYMKLEDMFDLKQIRKELVK